MKNILYSTTLFIISLVLISCFKIPKPVIDRDYKKSMTDYSWFEFKGKVYVFGGEHRKIISKKYEWSNILQNRDPYTYNYKIIPNKKIFGTGNQDLPFLLSFPSTSFNWITFSEWGLKEIETVDNKELYRDNQFFIEFKDRIWLVGGINTMNRKKYSDIFVSPDGINWEILLKDGPWAEGSFRSDHYLFVWKDRLLLYGGFTENGRVCDIWSTVTGKDWTREANFPELKDMESMFSFKDSVYFRGHNEETGRWMTYASEDGKTWKLIDDIWKGKSYNDNTYFTYNNHLFSATSSGLWISEDGRSWRELFNSCDFSRYIKIRNDEIWMTSLFLLDNHIAASKDGINWRIKGQITSFDFLPSDTIPYNNNFENHYEIVTFRNRLWIITGHPEGVWTSEDGLNWGKKAPDKKTTFPPRLQIGSTVYKNRIWMMGGRQPRHIHTGMSIDSTYSVLNDIHYTKEGTTWHTVTAEAPWPRRWKMKLVVWNNILYMIGGGSYGHNYYEIWKTADGGTWEKICNYYDLYDGDEIRPQFLNTIVFNNTLYIFDAYINKGCLIGITDTTWEYREFPGNSYDHPSLDNIVTFTTNKGKKILICKEDDEFYYSRDVLHWKPLDIIEEDNFPDWTSHFYNHDLVSFQKRLFLVQLKNGIVKSTELILTDNFKLKLETLSPAAESE